VDILSSHILVKIMAYFVLKEEIIIGGKLGFFVKIFHGDSQLRWNVPVSQVENVIQTNPMFFAYELIQVI